MNLADIGFLGFPTGFSGFAEFVQFLIGGGLDIVFTVTVLNMFFSVLHRLVLKISGVKS